GGVPAPGAEGGVGRLARLGRRLALPDGVPAVAEGAGRGRPPGPSRGTGAPGGTAGRERRGGRAGADGRAGRGAEPAAPEGSQGERPVLRRRPLARRGGERPGLVAGRREGPAQARA